MASDKAQEKFIPGSETDPEEIFKYPFTVDENTIEYIRGHGRIMFIVRGIAGTAKDSLTLMLRSKDRFPSSVVCCADNYFRNTFSSEKRDPKSLRESHMYCHKKVEISCSKGKHPIIVKNTHVKKFEVQKYLDLAAEYGYTVIIASTMNKFCISPEILAKSNTKELSVEYFMSRLKQWQEIFPVLLGWFISLDDTNFLLNQLQISLDYLLGDGRFCRIFEAYENEKLLEYYEARRLLYCVAACAKNNSCFALKGHYTSDKVQEHYGECFTLAIEGFLVTPTEIFAIVSLDKTMKSLHHSTNPLPLKSAMDDITNNLQNLKLASVQKNYAMHLKTDSFNKNFKVSKNNAFMHEQEADANININYCSLIHLVQKKGIPIATPWDMEKKFFSLLCSIANSDGIIYADRFMELEEAYRSCRLPGNAWILKHPCKISMKSIFTGLYL